MRTLIPIQKWHMTGGSGVLLDTKYLIDPYTVTLYGDDEVYLGIAETPIGIIRIRIDKKGGYKEAVIVDNTDDYWYILRGRIVNQGHHVPYIVKKDG